MFNFSNQTINEPLANGKFPIEFAMGEDDPEILKLVLEAGADPNIDLGFGQSPLFCAMDACIDCMIQNNRDTFFPDQLETVKILIDYSADPNKKINGKSPIDLINSYAGSKEGFDSLMNLFRPAIPNIDELIAYDGRI
jgi:ankyrin repeat protein